MKKQCTRKWAEGIICLTKYILYNIIALNIKSFYTKGGLDMAAVEITKDNFDQVIGASDVPVLVDFWASWCGPCKMLSPIVDAVSETETGIKVGKVNVDEEGELAEKFGISSIPCLILFKEGREAGRSVGMIPKEKVIEFARS